MTTRLYSVNGSEAPSLGPLPSLWGSLRGHWFNCNCDIRVESEPR